MADKQKVLTQFRWAPGHPLHFLNNGLPRQNVQGLQFPNIQNLNNGQAAMANQNQNTVRFQLPVNPNIQDAGHNPSNPNIQPPKNPDIQIPANPTFQVPGPTPTNPNIKDAGLDPFPGPSRQIQPYNLRPLPHRVQNEIPQPVHPCHVPPNTQMTGAEHFSNSSSDPYLMQPDPYQWVGSHQLASTGLHIRPIIPDLHSGLNSPHISFQVPNPVIQNQQSGLNMSNVPLLSPTTQSFELTSEMNTSMIPNPSQGGINTTHTDQLAYQFPELYQPVGLNQPKFYTKLSAHQFRTSETNVRWYNMLIHNTKQPITSH